MVLSCRKVQFAQTVINERRLPSHRAIAVGGSYRSFRSKCLFVFVRQLPHFQSAALVLAPANVWSIAAVFSLGSVPSTFSSRLVSSGS